MILFVFLLAIKKKTMLKLYFLTISLIFSNSIYSQIKRFSLEQSVLEENHFFRADKLEGFQWIINSHKYSYFTDSYRKIVIQSALDSKIKETITLIEINHALGIKLQHLFGFRWMDSTTLLINNDNKYYTYSTITKTGELLIETKANSMNHTFDMKKQYLAFTENNNLFYCNTNKEQIQVTLENNESVVSGQSFARNEFGISNGIFWSPKSNYLAFYQKDETDVANYPLLDINETPGKLINRKYPMIGQKSEKPKVGIYNLKSKKTNYINPRGNPDDYLTNLTWSPDEKYIIIAEVNRTQDNMSLNIYDAETGKFLRTILNEKSDKWVEPENPALFLGESSDNFIWVSEKDGYNNLYHYSIEGKLIKQLTQNNFPLKEIIGNDVSGKEIYFTSTGENPTNMLAFKVDLNGKQTLITKDNGVHICIPNFDGSYFFDEFSNQSTPSKSLLYDKNSNVQTLLESKNKFSNYQMGTSEIGTIKSANGFTDLYTRMIKPSHFYFYSEFSAK